MTGASLLWLMASTIPALVTLSPGITNPLPQRTTTAVCDVFLGRWHEHGLPARICPVDGEGWLWACDGHPSTVERISD